MSYRALVPFLIFSSLLAYEGYPVSLFDHVSKKSFELFPDGTDSRVLEVNGLQVFYDEIAKSKKPVVVKFYTASSPVTSLTAPAFQNMAEQFNDKVKFASLDISSNPDMIRKFMAFFVQLALKLKVNGDNPQFLGRMLELIQRFAALDQTDGSVPFVLYFRDGDLIFPENLDFLDKSKFTKSLQTQLIDYKKENFQNINLFEKEQESKKESWWERIKGVFKKK